MSNEQQVIDQAVCWAVLAERMKGGDLNPGDVVKGLTIPHLATGSAAAVDSRVDEATVEQRHIDGCNLLQANYPQGVHPWTVAFRIEPRQVETGEPK